MPIQPSPSRAARRSAAFDSPPTRIGGHGFCTGFGSNTTSSKEKNSPWCEIVSSVHSRLQTSIASSTRRPRVAKSSCGRDPLLLEPRRADPELEPAVRQEVDGLRAARRRERMPQPDVVDVRAEPHALGAAREEPEVRERVVDRRVGRDRRVLLTRVRRARSSPA